MVDWSLVFAGISSTVAVVLLLDRFVSKRKEMRAWLHNFRAQTMNKLDEKVTSRRRVVLLITIGMGAGALFSYYINAYFAWALALALFFGWLFIGGALFGHWEQEFEESIDDQVKRLVAEELKKREQQSN